MGFHLFFMQNRSVNYNTTCDSAIPLSEKISLVIVLYAYHFYLFILVRKFANDENTYSTRFYRFLNEAPVLIVLAIIVLAIVKYF